MLLYRTPCPMWLKTHGCLKKVMINDPDEYRRFQRQINIINDLGYSLNSQSVILDFGCGNGKSVITYRQNGYQAFGCDIGFKKGPYVDFLAKNGVIRLILKKDSYKIPFDNNTFDFVFSNMVFEHVQDYSPALSEIKRVLKPGGISLHVFPSRYKIKESHVYVPFASIVQKYWYLLLWAYLGIKKESQKNKSPKEIAKLNYYYLKNHTNYLKKAEIIKYISTYFDNLIFCGNLFLRHTRKSRFIYYLSKVFPFIPLLFDTFYDRVIFFRKV